MEAFAGQVVVRARSESPQHRVAYYGHDTWGMGVANALAAANAVASMGDGALGGLRGSPFVSGGSGNLSAEAVSFALNSDWMDRASFAAIVRLSHEVLSESGKPKASRAVDGSQTTACVFPWDSAPNPE